MLSRFVFILYKRYIVSKRNESLSYKLISKRFMSTVRLQIYKEYYMRGNHFEIHYEKRNKNLRVVYKSLVIFHVKPKSDKREAGIKVKLKKFQD